MNVPNLIASSNLAEKSNNCFEEKGYSEVGSTGTIAFAIFVGATVLSSSAVGKFVAEYDFTSPSYIQCINLNQEKGFADLCTNNSIDLMKIENISKIKKWHYLMRIGTVQAEVHFHRMQLLYLRRLLECWINSRRLRRQVGIVC